MSQSLKLRTHSFENGPIETKEQAARAEVVPFLNTASSKQGWQYGTCRIRIIAYYVPRILNRTVPAYRTSVQFLKRIVPCFFTYRAFNKSS